MANSKQPRKNKIKKPRKSQKPQSMIHVILTSIVCVLGAVAVVSGIIFGLTGKLPFIPEGKVTSKYIEEISMERALEIFDDGEDALIYFGFEQCPYCQKAKPILKQVAEETKTKVYYVKTRDDNKELTYTDSQRESLENFIGSFMQENEDEENKLWLYVPLLVYSDQGVVTKGYEGTGTKSSDMSKKDKKALKKEYQKIFRAYLD